MVALLEINSSNIERTLQDTNYTFTDDDIMSSPSNAGYVITWVIFVMACLGMPGNLLVIVVYSHNLTTSIRLYIFSLAISDTVICLTIIVTRVLRTLSAVPPYCNVVAMALISVAGSYSLYILTVTAVERYYSVSRPHTFTFSERRACVVLCALVPCSMASAALMMVPKHLGMPLLARFLALVMQSICTLIILTMYILMARIIGLRVRARQAVLSLRISLTALAEAHAQRHSNGTSGSGGGTSTETQKLRHRESAAEGARKKVTRVRGVWMLFVITVVFILCWLPLWIAQCGVPVPISVINLFILLSSVVNPLIYSFMSGMFRDDVKKYYNKSCVRTNNSW